jgi:hypothetical protein
LKICATYEKSLDLATPKKKVCRALTSSPEDNLFRWSVNKREKILTEKMAAKDKLLIRLLSSL